MPAPRKTTKSNASAKNANKAENNGGVAVVENAQNNTQNTNTQNTNTQNNNNNALANNTNKATTTQVVAQIDVGFGNYLTIRGEGAGLNWNSGQKMTFQNNAWVWNTNANKAFEFKVLLNDQQWAQGDNMKAKAGQKNVFKPQF